jgi:MinD-like ATPase involved in chromosome partitioning or flagellar assembly
MQEHDQAQRLDDCKQPDVRKLFHDGSPGVTILCCGEGHRAKLASEIAVIGGSTALTPFWLGSAETCRTMTTSLSAVLVIIGPGVCGVAPVNLVAALRRDDEKRLQHLEDEESIKGDALSIVLVEQQVSGSSASRARSAGANDVVNVKGLARVLERHVLLGLGNTFDSVEPGLAKPGCAETGSAKPGPSSPSKEGHPKEPATLKPSARAASELLSATITATHAANTLKVVGYADGPGVQDDDAPGNDSSNWFGNERLEKGISSPRHGLVCVTGARGGLGTTTIALLLAMLAGKAGISTALVDLDLHFGDLAYLLGFDDAPTVFDAAGLRMLSDGGIERVSRIREPREFMASIPGDVSFLAAPLLPEQGDALPEGLDGLLSSLEEGFDLVIADCGSMWGDAQAAAVARSGMVCLVMGQRPSSVAACIRASSLAVRLGVPRAHIAYVLNFCNQRGVVVPLDASVALGGVPVVELPDGGPMVGDLMGSGRPRELVFQGNPLIPAVQGLLSTISTRVGIEMPVGFDVPHKGLLSRGRRSK